MNSMIPETLHIKHGKTAGFFSNCSVRLKQIIDYSNKNNKFPQNIDSSAQFRNYKEDIDDNANDLTKYFFEQKPTPTNFGKVKFAVNEQYNKYKNIDFKGVTPLIKAYFSPGIIITNIIEALEKKYSIDYQNTCAVFYRGNDKVSETVLADYGQFFNKSKEILQNNPHIKFLIQTDELEFAEAFKREFSNSFWFDELSMINHNPNSSVHHSLPRNKRKEQAAYLLAAVIILSKAKHLITHSGNCGLWAVLYRGHVENVYQFLKKKNWKTQEIKKNFSWV